MKDFRGPLPLTDADFTRIRANVLAEVRSSRRPWLPWRLAFAAVVAAFAFWRLFLVPAIEMPGAEGRGLRAERSFSRPSASGPLPSPLPEPAVAESAPAVVESARSVAESAPPAVRVVRHRKQRRPAIEAVRAVEAIRAVEAVQAVQVPEPVRIEIQTSDPDIRIGWLPNMEKKS
jgi:hypothetical protein